MKLITEAILAVRFVEGEKTLIPFSKYMVWQCTKCGKWQGKQNNKWTFGMSEEGKAEALRKLNLVCIKCGKSRKFKDERKGMTRIKFYFVDHPHKIPLIVQKLEMMKQKII